MNTGYVKGCVLSFVIVFAVGLAAVARAGPYAVDDYVDKGDASIQAWAAGWMDYTPGSNVDAQWQAPVKALGAAVGDSYDVVSLGRGGSITMTFATPIANGAGADFAIFENAFNETFLELAYVEVSSDGVNFVRFDNSSLTTGPVSAFGEGVDASNLRQLAGKHMQGLGTLFDLDMLQYNTGDDASLLDLNNIGYVRLVDIVGDESCADTLGNVIYDPYPTVGSAGFDLDAIGVLNQKETTPVPIPGVIYLLGS